MADQVSTVIKQVGDPLTIRFSVIRTAGSRTASVSGPIRYDHLPTSLSLALLCGKVVVAAHLTSLGATMDHDHLRT
jgi:hypothetical protein